MWFENKAKLKIVQITDEVKCLLLKYLVSDSSAAMSRLKPK